jgi:hypothetical protein
MDAKIDKSEDVHLNKIPIPNEILKDFPVITNDNEKDFDYLVG